jgi:hypothetical protein
MATGCETRAPPICVRHRERNQPRRTADGERAESGERLRQRKGFVADHRLQCPPTSRSAESRSPFARMISIHWHVFARSAAAVPTRRKADDQRHQRADCCRRSGPTNRRSPCADTHILGHSTKSQPPCRWVTSSVTSCSTYPQPLRRSRLRHPHAPPENPRVGVTAEAHVPLWVV